MCGGGYQDNSDRVAQIEADRAREEAARAEAERQRQEEAFRESLNSAYQSAILDANNYFSSRGLNPEDYADIIASTATSRRSSVPNLDQAPGTYFNALGESVYNTAEEGARARALRDIDSFAGTGFERKLIADTADDPFIQSILEEQFGLAQDQLENQRARGVLTDSGFTRALEELTRQRSGASSNLDEIGQALLETGRGSLRNLSTEARTGANSLRLGSEFNPFEYQGNINDEVSSFLTGLGDRFRGTAPTDLFDVSRAFGRGGIAQGAQNTPFDPEASAGIFALFDEEGKKKKEKTSPILNPF